MTEKGAKANSDIKARGYGDKWWLREAPFVRGCGTLCLGGYSGNVMRERHYGKFIPICSESSSEMTLERKRASGCGGGAQRTVRVRKLWWF